jgi:hypothetical protein
MRRSFAAIMLAATSVVGLVAVGSVADAASATRDSVVASGTFFVEAYPATLAFSVTARSDAAGLHPSGRLMLEVSPGNFVYGKVTCLRIVGNQAYIGARVTHSTGFMPDPGLFIAVEDGASGTDLVNGATFTPLEPYATECPTTAIVHPVFPVDGSVTVFDAEPR